MLDADCSDCGRVLIGTRQIVSMRQTPAGIELVYVCSCGRPGALVTGRAARRPLEAGRGPRPEGPRAPSPR